MVFAVRGRVLNALRADPEWYERALRCRSDVELEQVIVDFGRARGFKVVEVPAK